MRLSVVTMKKLRNAYYVEERWVFICDFKGRDKEMILASVAAVCSNLVGSLLHPERIFNLLSLGGCMY